MPEKFQAWTGFERMSPAMPVQYALSYQANLGLVMLWDHNIPVDDTYYAKFHVVYP